MILSNVLLVLLIFIASIMVSGNNLSACVGPAIGSRILSKRFGILLGAIGFSAGLLIQGPTMKQSINTLLPNATTELGVFALLVSILIFVIAAIMRVPMSLNMTIVGLLAGLSLGGSNNSNSLFLKEVVATWILAPVLAATFSFVLIRILNKTNPTNIWKRIKTYKIGLILLSFSTAYVLGANTLGLIVATGEFNLVTLSVAVVGIFFGSFYLSEGTIKRLSQEFFLMRYANATTTLITSTILVEVSTLLRIPLSNTQTTTAAVFGSGISYRTKLVSLKPLLIIVAGWIIAPLISFIMGILIGYILV
jgi:PiT family inorganic phosphate transporter